MPEGAEVRQHTDLLKKHLTQIDSFKVLSGRYIKKPLPSVESQEVNQIGCKGKFVYIIGEKQTIWHTLGMSGNWSLSKLPYTRVVINNQLYYGDKRNFGTFKVGQMDTEARLQKLGCDLLVETKVDWLLRKILRDERTLAQILMDQSIFAGVGNYVKAEALYHAGLSPWDRKIAEAQAIQLIEAAATVLHQAYRGTLKRVVYRKKRDPTGRPVISEETLDKRTTWWVQQ